MNLKKFNHIRGLGYWVMVLFIRGSSLLKKRVLSYLSKKTTVRDEYADHLVRELGFLVGLLGVLSIETILFYRVSFKMMLSLC